MEVKQLLELRLGTRKKLGPQFYYTNSIALIIDMLKNIYGFKDKEDSFLLQVNIIFEINELKKFNWDKPIFTLNTNKVNMLIELI